MTVMDEESAQIEYKIDEEPSSLGDWLVWLVFQGIGYSFMIALLGLMGSACARFLGDSAGPWGWVGGALLAAVGYPLGWVRMENARMYKLTQAQQEKEERRPRIYMNPLKGALVGLFMGAILGIVVGMVSVIYWLSFALSPLAPAAWREGPLDTQSVTGPVTVILSILGWSVGGFVLVFLLLGLSGQVYETDRREKMQDQ